MIDCKELDLRELIFLAFEFNKAHLDVIVKFKHNLVLDDSVGILGASSISPHHERHCDIVFKSTYFRPGYLVS